MSVVFQITAGLIIGYENEHETLGMGGPFIGELFIDQKRTEGLYVVDDPIISLDREYLVLAKYKIEGNSRQDVHFTIVVLRLSDFLAYESNLKFELLYIDSMINNQIICYESTHNHFEDTKRIIEFSTEKFSLLKIFSAN